MTLSHNILGASSALTLSSYMAADRDMASKSEVLKRFCHHYDTPHDHSCLYWSFLFTSFLPLLENEDSFIEKFLIFFGQEHLDKFEKVSELLRSFDGFRVNGDSDIKNFVILHLRKKLTDYMLEHRDDYSPYIEDDESIESYALRMLDMHSWGGETEIKIFSDLFSIPIFVVSPKLLNVRVFGANHTQEIAICLQHNALENHYEFYLETPFIVKVDSQSIFLSKGHQDQYFKEAFDTSDKDEVFRLPQLVLKPKALRPMAKIPKVSQEDNICFNALNQSTFNTPYSSCSPFHAVFSDSQKSVLSLQDITCRQTSAFTSVLPLEEVKMKASSSKESKADLAQIQSVTVLEGLLSQYMTISTISDIEEEALKPIREQVSELLTEFMPQLPHDEFSQTEILNEFTLHLFKLNFKEHAQDLEVYLRSFIFEILRLIDPLFLPARNRKVVDFAHTFSSHVAIKVPGKLLPIFYVILDDIASSIELRGIDLKNFDSAYERLTETLYKQPDSSQKDEAMAVLDLIFNRIYKRVRPVKLSS